MISRARAVISDCGQYRYWLEREWEPGRAHAVFIMLNPSTADHVEDDPTIRRCVRFANAWGLGGVEVVNLFGFRATDPHRLADPIDPVGPDNDEAIRQACGSMDSKIIAAWGVGGDRYSARVRAAVKAAGRALYCLGTTKSGQPKHPLYLRADTIPQPWSLR